MTRLLWATMSGTKPFALVRRVFWPLVAGVGAAVVVRLVQTLT